MDDAGNRRAATIVDVRHRAGNGSRSGDATKEWRYHVCHTLRNEFHVRVMLVADNAIGYCRRQQALYGSENGYGEGNRHEFLDKFKGNARNNHLRQLCLNLKTVANRVDSLNAILLHNDDSNGSEQDAIKRTGDFVEARNLFQRFRQENDNQQRTNGNDEIPEVERPDVLGIANPFPDKITGRLQRNTYYFTGVAYRSLRQTENIADLRREDGQGNTCRETYNNRIRNELNNNTQAESAKSNEDDTSQDGGNEQALQTIFRVVDNAIDDDNEGTCRTTNLYFAAAEQ